MSFLPDLGHVVDAGSGVLLVALGLSVLRVQPGQRVTGAFALFSVSFGLMLLLGNVLSPGDPGNTELQMGAAFLGFPALAGLVALALWFPRPLAAAERPLAAAAAGAVALLAAVFAVRYAVQEPGVSWILVHGLYVLQFGFLFAILLLALRFRHAAGPAAARERQLCALMTVALLPWPALFAMTRMDPAYVRAVGSQLGGNWLTPAFRYGTDVFGYGNLAIFVVAYLLWLRNTRVGDPASRRLAARTAVLVLAAPVLAEGVLQTSVGAGGSGLYGAARILSVALLAYAILRYRLFDLDLRVKGTLRRAALVALVVGGFVLASQLAAALAGPTAGAAMGVLVLVGLVASLGPLQRVAQAVADAALPGVSDTPEYLNLRKIEVYRAALEQAAARGSLGRPAGDAELARLRAELGLSERDHAVLAYAARTGSQAAVLDLEAGALLLGRYRVARFLGEGAHGRTYLARDEQEGRDVVLKAVRPDKAGDPALLREARVLAGVRDAHVVRLLDAQPSRDAVLLVMEFVEGGSLRDRLDRGPLGPEEFRRVATGLLRALEAVHGAGIVHRDIKPSNVLLTREGEAKLADFGIAHLPGLETTVGGASGGSAVGTIKYMSPEQAKGRKVTPRSDLFSAAATLYEAWTGKPYLEPGPRESSIELQMRAAKGQPFKAKLQPPPMRAWFARALDLEPSHRHASAAAMRAALERALPSPTPG